MSELVVTTVAQSIATVRLNDPDSLNALSVPMANAFKSELERLAADESVRVLVVTGTGRGFCAGGDVQSFYDHRDDPHDVMQQVLDGLHGAIEVLLDVPFPTIAAINGTVAGAGMGVALATDLAIAVDSALFTMAYTGIGVSPDGSSTFSLPRLVGTRVAMDMILTNRRIMAPEAASLGLINQSVSEDDFNMTVTGIATRLAEGPTQAYVRSRRLIRESLGSDPTSQMAREADSILAASDTRDFYEGVTAFIEKRRPDFTGS